MEAVVSIVRQVLEKGLIAVAIKSGEIIHVGNDVVLIDRLQTAGPGAINIRRETIYELGNYRSVGQVSDIPDLTFTLESFDVSTEIEAFLLRANPQTTHTYDLTLAPVVNIKSAFKRGKNDAAPYDTAASAAVPCLRLEQMQYRFGVGNANARQTATLRGDSLYYNPGSCYIQEVNGSGSANQTIVLTHPAQAVTEGGVTRRTLAITAGNRRLLYGVDYTEQVGAVTGSAASVTVTLLDAVAVTDKVAVTYSSPDVEAFPQSVHALVTGVSDSLGADAAAGASTLTLVGTTAFPVGLNIVVGTGPSAEIASVQSQSGSTVTLVGPLVNAHTSGAHVAQFAPTVKPAALRGRDIDLYIGPAHPVGTAHADAIGTKRHGVQTTDVDWRVTLVNDEELGNPHYVDTDWDVAVVSGNISVRPRDAAAMLKLVEDLSGNTDPNQSTGVSEAPLMDVQVVLRHPESGAVLKRLHIPDARFTPPGYQGRVQQRTDFSAPFQSDQGLLYVYDS